MFVLGLPEALVCLGYAVVKPVQLRKAFNHLLDRNSGDEQPSSNLGSQDLTSCKVSTHLFKLTKVTPGPVRNKR